MKINTDVLDKLGRVKDTLLDLENNICWDCRRSNYKEQTLNEIVNPYIFLNKRGTNISFCFCKKHAKFNNKYAKIIKLSEQDVFYLKITLDKH